MELKPPINENYAAIVTNLSKFVDLPNCDNVKAALIFGNSVIVAKSSTVGELGLFFPVETQLSPEFLSQNNLYRKPEWGNVCPEQKGFFEQHGRVKAAKFRGHKSEGFWIPISCLNYLPYRMYSEGETFDSIGDHEICKKYVSKCNPARTALRGRQPRLEDNIVDKQFRFHYDTANLRRNIHKINPTDWISISDKWHGTSIVIANVLINRSIPWYEKMLQYVGVTIEKTQYGVAYSSRRVIKDVNGITKNNNHFYNEDIWGIVTNEIKANIPKGYTIYGEIVGYTPEGSPIQKGYHYGCPVGGHRLLVYRVTNTGPDGHVIELNWVQMLEFCTKYGLEPVRDFFYGQAQDLYPELDDNDINKWQEEFLWKLEKEYVTDQMCHYNNLEVPAEGIVLRIDKLEQSEAFKLKNFKFLEWESKQLDSGETDIETEESVV